MYHLLVHRHSNISQRFQCETEEWVQESIKGAAEVTSTIKIIL